MLYAQLLSVEEAIDINGWNLSMLYKALLIFYFSIILAGKLWGNLTLAQNR